jgi:hypothetical protein
MALGHFGYAKWLLNLESNINKSSNEEACFTQGFSHFLAIKFLI